jgi:ribonuclease G
MENEIVVNVDSGETRVALMEESQFAEVHIERERGKSVVGNVVKGRVSRVLPGMQAAFVDIGLEKAAFLYVGDYFDNTSGQQDSGPRRGKGRGRHSSPPRIDTVLSEGQEIVVQIAKAPIGTKGARITSNISIPGRHLVLTPWSPRVGVSRRIDSDKERRRLREIVDRLRPKNLGFIIRTAGDGVREADLEADIRYLNTVWQAILLADVENTAPCVLHAEPDLPLRIVRDAAGPDTKRIIVDQAETFETVKKFIDEFVAEPKPQVDRHEGLEPLFEKLGLEAQIHANLERKVWLKSGGSLIVDQCEALTAIDVNTGRFVGKRDLEETVYRTNLEAVKEVVNQLRFRNIGGLIIIDLIDMESTDHREKTYRALRDALRHDKARTNILKISELGLVEMTRKRTRENLVQTLCEPCTHCDGRGYLLSGETVTYNLLREVRNSLSRFSGRRIAVTVAPRVAEQLLGDEAASLASLSGALGQDIEIRARPGIHQEQFEVEALDEGPPVSIPLRWLRDPAEIAAEEEEARNQKSRSGSRRGSRRRDRERRGGQASGPEAQSEAGSAREGTPESPNPDTTNPDTTNPDAKNGDGADSAAAEAGEAAQGSLMPSVSPPTPASSSALTSPVPPVSSTPPVPAGVSSEIGSEPDSAVSNETSPVPLGASDPEPAPLSSPGPGANLTGASPEPGPRLGEEGPTAVGPSPESHPGPPAAPSGAEPESSEASVDDKKPLADAGSPEEDAQTLDDEAESRILPRS